RAGRVARTMNADAAQAELEIEHVLLTIESTPGFAKNPALQQRHHRLDEQERKRRIPFLRGIGAFLHAEINLTDSGDSAGAARLFALAAESLAPLLPSLNEALAAQARLYAGLAQMRLGQFDAADQSLRAVIASGGAPADVFLARIGLVMNHAAHS